MKYQDETAIDKLVKYLLCFLVGIACCIGATLNYLGMFYLAFGKQQWIEHMSNFSTVYFASLLIAGGLICILLPLHVFLEKYRA